MEMKYMGMPEDEFKKMVEGMERKNTLHKGMNANSREEPIRGLYIDPKPVLQYQGKPEVGGRDTISMYRAVYQGAPTWLLVAVWHSKFPYSAYGKRENILDLLTGERLILDQKMGPYSRSLLKSDTGLDYPGLVKIGIPIDITLVPRTRAVTYCCAPGWEYRTLYGDPEYIIGKLVEMKYISAGKVEAPASQKI